MWREKLKLGSGESLRHMASQSKGHLGQKEIVTFAVVDSAGNVTGSVTLTEDISIKAPFERSYWLVQRAVDGRTIVDERW